MIENGQRLLELCSYYSLCITNTFYSQKPIHRVLWCHPRSGHWHQFDLVITRRCSLNTVLHTRSFHSADCDTDNSLVAREVHLQPEPYHRSKQKGHPRISTARTQIPSLCRDFATSIENALQGCHIGDAEKMWHHMCEAISNSALNIFSKKERHNPDWFEAGINMIEPAIEAKRTALLKHKRAPSASTLAAFRKARNHAQCIARRCANEYWMNLYRSIQRAADSGNTRAMYDGLKCYQGYTSEIYCRGHHHRPQKSNGQMG